MKYRKRPLLVDAIRLPPFMGPAAASMVFDFFDEQEEMPALHITREGVHLTTLEGEMLARPGDWIIRGVKGEYYPCKDEIFRETYELVATTGPIG